MKVKELIKELKKYDSEQEVYINNHHKTMLLLMVLRKNHKCGDIVHVFNLR